MLSTFRSNPAHARALVLALAATLAVPAVAGAQGRTLTAQDYAQAERFVGYNANPLLDHAVTDVTWLDDDRFRYRDHDATGDHFLVMDARDVDAPPVPAFDQARLAAALSKASGKTARADNLPLTEVDVAADGSYVIE